MEISDIYDDYYKAVKENLELKDENRELKQKLEKAKRALEFYANWANYNSEGAIAHWDSEKVEMLGDIDHKPGFICGKQARKALKEIGE
jgi:cell division septum initiation protein DivIVA